MTNTTRDALVLIGQAVTVIEPGELIEGPDGDPVGVAPSQVSDDVEVLAVVITEREAVVAGMDPYAPPPGVRVIGDGRHWTGGDL